MYKAVQYLSQCSGRQWPTPWGGGLHVVSGQTVGVCILNLTCLWEFASGGSCLFAREYLLAH